MNSSRYQQKYKDKIGQASVDVKKVVAGDKFNCRLTYEVGDLDIDDGGSLKVLYRIASDAGELQFVDDKKENFTRVYSSNKKVSIKLDPRSGGTGTKLGIRPWSRGLDVALVGDNLKKGDKVYIEFKNWRAQTFCENNFQLKVLVDPFSTGRYIELVESPSFEVIHGKPSELTVVAPSQMSLGQTYPCLVKIADEWGNPCSSLTGEFEIINHQELGIEAKLKFKDGRVILNIKPNAITDKKYLFIEARYQSLKSTSNPILIGQSEGQPKYHWAELHAQSGETVGTNSIESYFNFAKQYAFVDILSHQGNDFEVTDDFWQKINDLSARYNQPGEFVTFPGYEWSGNTSRGGDRNVIYQTENYPIYRSSHALVDDNGNNDDVPNVQDLFKKIAHNKQALVVAHVGGRRADLSLHDAAVEKLVEVHSCWGTFEWFLFDALKRGYVVGTVAGSDGHDGRPGASYPGSAHFVNQGGLTCVLSNQLERQGVFDALKNRHCYATTGARILLDVSLKGADSGEALALMGDVVTLGQSITKLSVKVMGTAAIEKVQIYNQDKIIKTILPFSSQPHNDTKYIKIAWTGANSPGRSRIKSWVGKLELNKCQVNGKIETVNFFNPLKNKFTTTGKNKNIVSWVGETGGNTQALIVPVKRTAPKGGALELDVNGKTINLNFDQIHQQSKKYKFDGLDAYLEIYETTKEYQPTEISFEEKLNRLNKGLNSILIKVTQRDGQLAWSSPIFIKTT